MIEDDFCRGQKLSFLEEGYIFFVGYDTIITLNLHRKSVTQRRRR